MKLIKHLHFMAALTIIIFFSGCSLAPSYHRPEMCIPPGYKETGKWLKAHPKGDIKRGPWWEMYGDPILNELEAQVVVGNQNLKAALARYDQSRAALGVARAALFPTILGFVNGDRVATSKTIGNPAHIPTYNDTFLRTDLTYEIDVWGQVRNTVASANYLACASADDLSTMELSLHAELANDYFALRGTDEAQQVLDETVRAYQEIFFITRQRFIGGAVPQEDLDQAQSQLEYAKTLAAENHIKRAQLEHAIANLIGKVPACFSLPPLAKYNAKIVTINPYLPSKLLERRPDIAAAESRVQAANAYIGVTRAAFFPDINITLAFGYNSQSLANLLKAPSLIWSVGPGIINFFNPNTAAVATQVIYDGGRICGLNSEAWARYMETVANYRQIVLNAFQEVEDNLVAIRQLDVENKTQTAATIGAKRALQQSWYRYRGGLVTYLEVGIYQILELQNELSLIDVQTRRQIASVQLIKALGGGWPCEEIKKPLVARTPTW